MYEGNRSDAINRLRQHPLDKNSQNLIFNIDKYKRTKSYEIKITLVA